MTAHAGPSVSASFTDPVLADLVEELAKKLQAGEIIDLDAVAAQHPHQAGQIRQLLPAVQLLAELGSSSGQDRGPLAALVTQSDPSSGTLGDYHLIREVGRGGMGVVYEAQQISLSRRVALKVLPFAAALDAKQLQRFKNEAQAAAHLHHTNIVPVYAVGCERSIHFYAMQFIDGQCLAAMIHELRQQAGLVMNSESTSVSSALDKGLPSGRRATARRGLVEPPATETYRPTAPTPGEPAAETAPVLAAGHSTERSTSTPAFFRTVARLGFMVAEALEHAHQLGVIHRDIKPANLLVDARGNLWVTDFGLAHVQSQVGLTMTGDLVGTLRYMSPEQALAKRVLVDQRTDIYSLGATLYELLTLEPVFSGRDRQELLRQIAFDDPRPPRQINKAIPQELETVVLKAMGKDPGDRYATAQELANDLDRFLKDEPIRARRPTLIQRARSWARRHAGVTVTAGVALALLLVLTSLGLAVNNVMVRREQERTQGANDRLQGNLALSLKTLDEIYLQVLEDRMARDPAAAQENQELLTKALGFYEQFAQRNEAEPNVRSEVASAYDRAGVLHTRLGHYDQAIAALGRAQDIAARLSADLGAERELNGFLAEVHLHKGQLANDAPLTTKEARQGEAAQKEYRKGIELLEPLIEKGDLGLNSSHTLASLHSSLASIAQHGGDLMEGEKQYRKAIAVQKTVVDIVDDLPRKLFAMQQLAASHAKLGDLLGGGEGAGRLDEARDELRQAILLLTRIDTQAAILSGYLRGRLPGFPNGQPVQSDLARVYWNLGANLRYKGYYKPAEGAFRQAVEYSTQVITNWPMEPLFRRRLAIIRRDFGILLFEQGKRPEALQQCRQSVDLLVELDKQFPGVPDNQEELTESLDALAEVLFTGGDHEKAAEYFRQFVDLKERLVARSPDDATHCGCLAWFYAVCVDPRFRNPGRAVVLADKAAKQFPENGWYSGVLGVAHYRNSQWKQAVACLEKANQLRPYRYEGFLLYLAMAHWQLGERAAARTCYERAVELITGRDYPAHVANRAHAEARKVLGISEQKH